MVLAIGHWLSASEKDHAQAPYYSAARSMFTIKLLEAGTLGTVQALLLMGNYLQKMDRPNTGYNFVGIAYRMALGLGLHREAPMISYRDILAHERRRQVFWTLYCFDSGFSITTGRPTTISDAFIDVKLPRNIDDHRNRYWPSLQIGYTPFQCLLGSRKQGWALTWPPQKNRLMDGEGLCPHISIWATFPAGSGLREQFYSGKRRTFGFFFGRRWNVDQAVFDICSFCRENVDLVHRGINWYATYFLFQATLVLLLFELQAARDSRRSVEHHVGSWTQGIAQARDCLTLLGKESHAAERCLAVLRRIQCGTLVPSLDSSNTTTADNNAMFDPVFNLDDGQAGGSLGLAHMLLQDEASPETAALFANDWSTAADPSLSTFLGDNSMQNFFQDFNGFPGTVESNYFDYINYNMYNAGNQT
ncbi:hypothetical protein FKW77_000584 [Venturia effusa]|uniref:Xylanolytic transcriptional activator regulatory domain-containing protein n=1 Tax=Venturia effusa TaxID=50376 RepID=A0A517KVP5_9PEZI|nr:hypothetical protein FKW77_000584 [Venturia effusa]